MRRAAKVWLGIVPLPLTLLLLAALLWMHPLIGGTMPTTADHTVHLARAQEFCEVLGRGQLRSFSQFWGFGVPIGELYPVLGDLGYCAAKAVGIGTQRAYAWVFALVMLVGIYAQYALGESLLGKKHPKLGVVAGLAAALFFATDLGAYREGGWVYTVMFGVWPQSLATSLTWLALLALHRAVRDPGKWRSAALLVAAALLAHPMALLHLGVAGLLWALTQRKAHSAERAFWCVSIGAGLSAWWWVPMLSHRGWMANYGWLYDSTRLLTKAAMQGQLTQAMPSLVGYAAILGMAAALLGRHRWRRAIAAAAMLLWLLTSRSLFEGLRFDLWGSAWTHLQYQRFLISAKPAFFALAGLGLCVPALLIKRALRRPLQPRMITVLTAMSVLSLAFMVQKVGQDRKAFLQQAKELGWGEWTGPRMGAKYKKLDEDYLEFLDWAQMASENGAQWRVHLKDYRNLHWFMDLTAYTRHQVYKSGFTPGDNFRHKPESRHAQVLSKLGLTHELSRVAKDAPVAAGTRRWGTIQLRPLAASTPEWKPVIRDSQGRELDAGAMLTKIDEEHWHLELPQQAEWPLQVTLPIAHYPRWELRYLGQSLTTTAKPAIEVPEQETTLSVPPGRAYGHNGRQPLLLSFEAPGPGSYELEYRAANWLDRLGFWVSLLCGLSLATRQAPRIHPLPLRPIALGAGGLIAVVLGGNIVKASNARSEHWSQRYEEPSTKAHRIAPGLIKSNMVIERALIARPKQGNPATLRLTAENWSARTGLWWSLDDDRAQQKTKPAPTYEIRVWLGEHKSGEPDFTQRFAHRPDRHTTILDTSALVNQRASIWVELHSDRKRQTRIALEAYPWSEPSS